MFTCSQCNNLLNLAFQSYIRPDMCCFCKKKQAEAELRNNRTTKIQHDEIVLQ